MRAEASPWGRSSVKTGRTVSKGEKTMTRISKVVLRDMFETVERTRDELRLQAHLGKEEAKDEATERWHALEDKWRALNQRRSEIAEVAEDAGEGVLEGLKLSLEELRDGYERLRKRT